MKAALLSWVCVEKEEATCVGRVFIQWKRSRVAVIHGGAQSPSLPESLIIKV